LVTCGEEVAGRKAAAAGLPHDVLTCLYSSLILLLVLFKSYTKMYPPEGYNVSVLELIFTEVEVDVDFEESTTTFNLKLPVIPTVQFGCPAITACSALLALSIMLLLEDCSVSFVQETKSTDRKKQSLKYFIGFI
jgi:hypothetical protein